MQRRDSSIHFSKIAEFSIPCEFLVTKRILDIVMIRATYVCACINTQANRKSKNTEIFFIVLDVFDWVLQSYI